MLKFLSKPSLEPNSSSSQPVQTIDGKSTESFQRTDFVRTSLLTVEDLRQARSTGDVINGNHGLIGKWISYGSIMYKFYGSHLKDIATGSASIDTSLSSEVVKKRRILAFDMDSTLITTRSGAKFPKDGNDWKLWDPSIRTKLQQLAAEGAHVVIISNQSGLRRGRITADTLQRKVDAIVAALSAPPKASATATTADASSLTIDFICALEDDHFRKPSPSMWDFICAARCREWDIQESMYIGDAAGRAAHGPRKKDFSDSDYRFAINVGVQFQTPEAFFLGSAHRLHCHLPYPYPSVRALPAAVEFREERNPQQQQKQLSPQRVEAVQSSAAGPDTSLESVNNESSSLETCRKRPADDIVDDAEDEASELEHTKKKSFT